MDAYLKNYIILVIKYFLKKTVFLFVYFNTILQSMHYASLNKTLIVFLKY